MRDLYNFGLMIFGCLGGAFLLYFVGHIILNYCVAFVNDEDFKPTKMLKWVLKKLDMRYCDTMDAVGSGVLTFGVLGLSALIWPLTLIIGLISGILFGVRYITRLKKKLDKIAKTKEDV